MKSSNKQILVVGDRILIRPDTGESKSPAGLYLPPSVIEKQEVRGGMVVEVGPGIPLGNPDGTLDEPWKEKNSDVKYIPTQAEIGSWQSGRQGKVKKKRNTEVLKQMAQSGFSIQNANFIRAWRKVK